MLTHFYTNYKAETTMSVLTDDIRSSKTVLSNINDVAELITDGMFNKKGDVENQIKNSLYKATECGMWFTSTTNGFDIGSIVEGSQAEFSKSFVYPVDSDKLADAIDEIEICVDEYWNLV